MLHPYVSYYYELFPLDYHRPFSRTNSLILDRGVRRGFARKGAVTGSLDGGAFTIRRARTPAREPRQRCHLLPWPSMAAAACWRKRKGERRRVTGHGPVAGLRPCAGGAAPHSRRQRGEGRGGAAPLRPLWPPPFGGQKEREKKEMS